MKPTTNESIWIWPFELVEKIGEGGMGVVYRARYVPKKNAPMVAVKLLPTEDVDPVILERFDRETKLLKSLRHPNVVHTFGGVCEDDRRFYAMEYVSGGTLSQQIRRQRQLPWQTVVEYGKQMCAGLQAAHDAGVVHRDVKPSNFLLTKEGRIKLSDFGLAAMQAAHKLTADDKTLGTFPYMAPEQIQARPVSVQTDLYALGCVFYEMLTGRPPFKADPPWGVMKKHLEETPEPISASAPDCPPALEQLVDELLEKNPADRPASAGQVAARLEAMEQSTQTAVDRYQRLQQAGRKAKPAATGGEVSARPKPRPRSGGTAGGRGDRYLAIAFAVLFFVAAVWGFYVYRGTRPSVRFVEQTIATFQAEADDVPEQERISAAERLGTIGRQSPRIVEILEGGLEDPSPLVREAAAGALGECGDEARSSIPTLIRVQRDDTESQVRIAAGEALNRIRESDSEGDAWGWLFPVLLLGGIVAAFVAVHRYGPG